MWLGKKKNKKTDVDEIISNIKICIESLEIRRENWERRALLKSEFDNADDLNISAKYAGEYIKILKNNIDILNNLMFPRDQKKALDLYANIRKKLNQLDEMIDYNTLGFRLHFKESMIGARPLIEELSSLIDELSCT